MSRLENTLDDAQGQFIDISPIIYVQGSILSWFGVTPFVVTVFIMLDHKLYEPELLFLRLNQTKKNTFRKF